MIIFLWALAFLIVFFFILVFTKLLRGNKGTGIKTSKAIEQAEEVDGTYYPPSPVICGKIEYLRKERDNEEDRKEEVDDEELR